MMFVIKSIVVTVLILMFLQIEFGGSTLETRAQSWLAHSSATQQLHQVAGGAIKISQDFWKKDHRWAGLDSSASPGKKAWAVEFRHKKTDTESEE